jgi:hypothetical protein
MARKVRTMRQTESGAPLSVPQHSRHRSATVLTSRRDDLEAAWELGARAARVASWLHLGRGAFEASAGAGDRRQAAPPAAASVVRSG